MIDGAVLPEHPVLQGAFGSDGAVDHGGEGEEGRAADPTGAGQTDGMSYVAINVLTVPAAGGATLEERFAARQGSVDAAPGFEHFELLRPVEGTDDYLVYTRWRSEDDFRTWRASQAFGQGHAQASGRPEGERPAASGSTIWAFEVVQSSDGKP